MFPANNTNPISANQILEDHVLKVKRGRMNSFGFEPAWNAYFDFYLSDKYLEKPILQLEDVTFHLFLRKNLNDNDPTWKMPSIPEMKRKFGIGQGKIEGMIERLTQAHLLDRVSGKRRGRKGADTNNDYILSDPIQGREEFLAVAEEGRFPQPLKDKWKGYFSRYDHLPEEKVTTPLPETGKAPPTTPYPFQVRALPKTGNHEHTSFQQTSEDTTDNNNDVISKVEEDVCVVLLNSGVVENVAQRLAARYSKERILEKVDFLKFELEESPTKIKSPGAWLRKAIEEDYPAPNGYKAPAQREREAAEKKKREKEINEVMAAQERRLRRELEEKEQAREENLTELEKEYGTTSEERKLWHEALKEIENQLPQATFYMWLADSELLSLKDGKAVITAINSAARSWMKGRFATVIQRTLKGLTGQTLELEFVEVGRV